MKFPKANFAALGTKAVGAAVGLVANEAADKYLPFDPMINGLVKVGVGVAAPMFLGKGKMKAMVDMTGDTLFILGLNDLKDQFIPGGIFGIDNDSPRMMGQPYFPQVRGTDNQGPQTI